jgi:hypothetical protein
MNDSIKPRLSRRIALLGTSAMLGAAGVGTYLVVSASSAGAHLTRATTHTRTAAAHVAAAAPAAVAPVKAAPAAAPAVDPDNIQSGDQTGPDTSTGGSDTAQAGGGSESGGSEGDGPGGWADPAGSTGVNGDFNN